MERVGPARVDGEHGRRSVVTGSKITNIGIPDSNINQLTEEQLALGPTLLKRVPNPYFGIVPRSSSIGDPTITRAQLMKPFPDYTAVSYYRNNVGTTNYQGLAFSIRQRLSRGLTYSAAYTRSKLTDIASSVFDASILTGPLTNAAVADSHNLERDRDYSTGDIPHYFAASVVWDLPVGRAAPGTPGRGRRARERLEHRDVHDPAVGGAGRGDPGELARVRRLHDPAPNLVGDPALPADERSPARWFNTAAFATANQFTIGSASRNPVRGPTYRDVDLAVMRRVRRRGQRAIELRVEIFNLLNTANSVRRRRSSARRTSGRSPRRSIPVSCNSRRSSGSDRKTLSAWSTRFPADKHVDGSAHATVWDVILTVAIADITDEKQNDGNDQQHMNERADRVRADDSEQPGNQQNDGDGVQHGDVFLDVAIRLYVDMVGPCQASGVCSCAHAPGCVACDAR